MRRGSPSRVHCGVYFVSNEDICQIASNRDPLSRPIMTPSRHLSSGPRHRDNQDAGGNFLDTANAYTVGRSEELVGTFVAERNLRYRMVIATKFTFNTDPGNPNTGGNGRKNIYAALEKSLRRLKTDYVDLYYVHAWDVVTPFE